MHVALESLEFADSLSMAFLLNLWPFNLFIKFSKVNLMSSYNKIIYSIFPSTYNVLLSVMIQPIRHLSLPNFWN